MEKRKDIRNIYLPPEFQKIWDDFVKICNREGKSASEKIREYIQRYVEQHKAGNPQLLMVHYVKPEEPQPFRVKCPYLSGVLSPNEVYCRKAGMWVKSIRCYSCKHNQLRKNR